MLVSIFQTLSSPLKKSLFLVTSLSEPSGYDVGADK